MVGILINLIQRVLLVQSNTKNICKIGLAVCDTLVLVGLLTTRGFPVFGNFQTSSFINQVGSVLSPVSMPLVLMGFTASTLMTVFLSLERYFAICHKKPITYKKVYISMAVIGIYSFLRFLPTFWLRRITTKDGVITSEMNEDLNGNENFQFYVLYLPNLILRFILPTIVLIVTSVLTLKEVNFLQKMSMVTTKYNLRSRRFMMHWEICVGQLTKIRRLKI